jgi:hypothetical protein
MVENSGPGVYTDQSTEENAVSCIKFLPAWFKSDPVATEDGFEAVVHIK